MATQGDDAGKSALLYDTRFKIDYLKPGYFSTWLQLLLLFILLLMPAFVQDFIANRLGDFARKSNSKRRRIARKNIDLCFPGLDEASKKQMLLRNFRHQARSIVHYGLIWWAPKFVLRRRIQIVGEEYLDEIRSRGNQVIIMAAHSLALEAAVSATTMRHRASGPFNPMKNRLVDWFVARGRSRFGSYVYSRDVGLRPIIKDVRAGCLMFYLPDEDLGKERSIFAPLYGVQKATVPVLGRLAKSCKAEVIPCMTCYDETTRKYIVHYLPPMQDFPQGNDLEDTTRMNQALEEAIAICPEQYFWTMKLFKTRPEGEKSFYS